MKCCKRSLSLLLCFVLLFPVFSTIANAEEVEVKPYVIYQTNTLYEEYGHYARIGDFTFYPNNGEEETHSIKAQYKTGTANFTLYVTKNATSRSSYNVKNVDLSAILQKDKTYKVKLQNVYHSLLFEYNGYIYYIRNPKLDNIVVNYTDGSVEEITDYSINYQSGTPYFDVAFNINTSKDVHSFTVNVSSKFKDCLPSEIWTISNGYPDFTAYFGEYNGDDKYQFSLEVESQESGLLKNLIAWVKGIKTKLDDTFTSIKDGFLDIGTNFSNLILNITELPLKIWEFISDGLIELFVPSPDDMAEYRTKWDNLLCDRFGALYEVGGIIERVTDSVIPKTQTAAVEGTITIPKVSLDSFGIPFEFGGYTVDIKPEGFDELITICKRIISIVCTLSFITICRREYERIIGG